MIELRSVCKQFQKDVATLSDVTFTINSGSLVTLIGHSGAGKSTLLRMIATLDHPTSGKISINNRDISRISRSALPYVRRQMGLVMQDNYLLFDRTVFDNVLLPLAIAGACPRAEAQRRVYAALDKVDLLSRRKAMPITLSGGEQQRIALARAVVSRPSLILADEPTAHLDKASAQKVANILQEFHREGTTVLIATYAAELFPCTQRICLSQGQVIADEIYY